MKPGQLVMVKDSKSAPFVGPKILVERYTKKLSDRSIYCYRTVGMNGPETYSWRYCRTATPSEIGDLQDIPANCGISRPVNPDSYVRLEPALPLDLSDLEPAGATEYHILTSEDIVKRDEVTLHSYIFILMVAVLVILTTALVVNLHG